MFALVAFILAFKILICSLAFLVILYECLSCNAPCLIFALIACVSTLFLFSISCNAPCSNDNCPSNKIGKFYSVVCLNFMTTVYAFGHIPWDIYSVWIPPPSPSRDRSLMEKAFVLTVHFRNMVRRNVNQKQTETNCLSQTCPVSSLFINRAEINKKIYIR